MFRIPIRYLALAMCATISPLSGCVALSFGGKSQQVETVNSETPQTQERLGKLESRVEALEQILPPQPALPVLSP